MIESHWDADWPAQSLPDAAAAGGSWALDRAAVFDLVRARPFRGSCWRAGGRRAA